MTTFTDGDDVYSAGLGFEDVNALGGTDTLVLNYGTLTGPIRCIWEGTKVTFTDDHSTGIVAYNFEKFEITGGSGADYLHGGGLADKLNGGAGNDTIESGMGQDQIDGGVGADRWTVNYSSISDDQVIQLLAGGAVFTVATTGATIKNIEAISITTGVGDDIIDTSAVAGDDSVILGVGDDTFSGGRGFDYADGGDGADTLTLNFGYATTDVYWVDLNYGNARYTNSDGFTETLRTDFIRFEKYNITGGAGNDDLRGGNDNDFLSGRDGNDILYGYGGIDTIGGGLGADTWVVDYTAFADDIGIDISTAVGVVSTGATVNNVEALSATTGAGDDTITANAGAYNDSISTGLGNDIVSTGRGLDNANGGDGDDLLVMNWSALTTSISWTDDYYGHYHFASADGLNRLDYYAFERYTLTGGSADDVLIGGGGYDTLIGGGGADFLNSAGGDAKIDGGAGNDIWAANLNASGEAANVLIDCAGSQTVSQGVAAGLDIRNIECLQLTTDAGADVISTAGYALNDSVSTRAGDDSVNLGLGKDSADGGDATDTLIMNWSTVTTSISWTDDYYGHYHFATADGVNRLDYYQFERYTLTGGTAADTLIGGGDYDVLVGGGGNDYLDSKAGSAKIDGGTANDTWVANLSAKAAKVLIDCAASQTVSQGALAGMDVRNIECLQLTTGVGADVISTAGYAFNDSVATGGGNDSIALGLGRDYADGGDGVDTLTINYSTATTSVRWTDLYYGNYQYADAAGTRSIRYYGIEKFVITGGSGGDQLRGGGYNDTLSGGGGNDILNSFQGVDVVNGGVGNDLWIGDQSSAVKNLTLVLNATGDGTLVNNGTQLTGIENIQLSAGSGSDTIDTHNVVGNDNVSTNAGNDAVNLGRGIDRADGGVGSDLLIFDFSSSTSSVTGTDLGYGWWKLADSDGVNSITFANFEQFDMTGGSGDDRLYGGGADDKINGGVGNDVMEGYGGNDLLTGGAGNDVFRFESGGNGVDTITDAAGGDIIRILNASLVGTVSSGDGTTLGNGGVQISG